MILTSRTSAFLTARSPSISRRRASSMFGIPCSMLIILTLRFQPSTGPLDTPGKNVSAGTGCSLIRPEAPPDRLLEESVAVDGVAGRGELPLALPIPKGRLRDTKAAHGVLPPGFLLFLPPRAMGWGGTVQPEVVGGKENRASATEGGAGRP